jgi:hypothetical protein
MFVWSVVRNPGLAFILQNAVLNLQISSAYKSSAKISCTSASGKFMKKLIDYYTLLMIEICENLRKDLKNAVFLTYLVCNNGMHIHWNRSIMIVRELP